MVLAMVFLPYVNRWSLPKSSKVPNTVHDILEEALEPWLKGRGYLK